jgi:hypothetical protein
MLSATLPNRVSSEVVMEVSMASSSIAGVGVASAIKGRAERFQHHRVRLSDSNQRTIFYVIFVAATSLEGGRDGASPDDRAENLLDKPGR